MSDHNLGPYRIRPRGEYNGTTTYHYLDLVKYEGSTYLCISMDPDYSCTSVLPKGEPSSEFYWVEIGSKGDKGDTATTYSSFVTLDSMHWDYSISDKVIIPMEVKTNSPLDIDNIYNGCCGMIITPHELSFHVGGNMFSTDFNYVKVSDVNELYCYTFIAVPFGDDLKLIWHRSVITG